MDNNTIENGSSNLTLLQGEGLPQENMFTIALRHRWTILCTIMLIWVASFIYILKATPIYTSTSRLYVEQTGPKIINEYEGIMTRSKNYLFTQAELIKSTPIVAEVADKPYIKKLKTSANIDNLVAHLKRNLDVSIGKKDDIIAISFNSPYPEEAAQIVNETANSYLEYHSTRKRSTVSEVLRILQKEMVKRDKELSDKFQEILEFTRENGVVSFDNKGGHIVFERLTKLSNALTEAQLATINAKADFEATVSMAHEPAKIKQFASASPTSSIRVFVNDIESQLQSELREAEVKLKSLKYHCTEDHPSVKAVQAKIDHIKQQLNKEASEFAAAYIEVMRLRWKTAKQRENELLTSYDEQHRVSQDLGIKAVEYSVLQSELRRLERLCEILDDRIKELNVTEDVGALNISILEVARPMDYPSKPKKAKIMALALAFGIMAGCGLALLRDWLDYRLRSADEISAILQTPILGVVPRMTQEQRVIVTHGQKVWLKLKTILIGNYRTIRSALVSILPKRKTKPKKQTIMDRAATYRATRTNMFNRTPRGKEKATTTNLQMLKDEKSPYDKQGIMARGQKVLLEPRSVVAEAYRTIRTAVFFGALKDQAKIILITSPGASDGKSTIASNLAIAMAQAGQKTLVLDGDFRKPMQHRIFDIDDNKGVSSVLAGQHTIDEAIQAGPIKELDILSCGPEVPNPSEILNSDLFATLLKNISGQYDRVIIDSPPVTLVADSQILGAICDTTILVLRVEQSTRRLSQRARDNLLSVGAHILGVVVNDVSRKHRHYGYYSDYGYYSHYGYYGSGAKKTG